MTLLDYLLLYIGVLVLFVIGWDHLIRAGKDRE